jgi:hypothetical protein
MEIRVNKLARILGFNAEGLSMILSDKLFDSHLEIGPNTKLCITDVTRADMVESSSLRLTTPEDKMSIEELYQRRERIDAAIARYEVIQDLRHNINRCVELGISSEEMGSLLSEGVFESSMNQGV